MFDSRDEITYTVGTKVAVGSNSCSRYARDHDEPVWLGTIIYDAGISVGVRPDDGGLGRDVLKYRVVGLNRLPIHNNARP